MRRLLLFLFIIAPHRLLHRSFAHDSSQWSGSKLETNRMRQDALRNCVADQLCFQQPKDSAGIEPTADRRLRRAYSSDVYLKSPRGLIHRRFSLVNSEIHKLCHVQLPRTGT